MRVPVEVMEKRGDEEEVEELWMKMNELIENDPVEMEQKGLADDVAVAMVTGLFGVIAVKLIGREWISHSISEKVSVMKTKC